MVPAEGVYTPVMALKQVVFPAPFGPISPKICWGSMAKVTSCRATRPPKRMVSRSSWRTGGAVSTMLDRFSPVFQLGGAPAARHDALGAEDHHHDQRSTEDEHAVLREAAEALGQVADDDGADDGADKVAGA